ncbi:SGNH hydrolase [Penicillium sp. IBT 18751x]|nr:SGNH hydrolase [Penicillium sp. IBT 18751x]
MEKLSILCFGDSLTSGYYRYGLKYHPYAIKLTAILEAEFPTTKIHLEVDGLPGDEVTHPAGEFLPRIRDQCAKTKFDWVIILGGTNDLGVGQRVDLIYHALEDCWNVALSSGAKVLAMTVPECAAKLDSLDTKRNTLNSHILKRESEQIHVIDLHSKIPYHSATEAFQREMFDDGLHLTAMGYDLMGTVVGESLVNLIKEE